MFCEKIGMFWGNWRELKDEYRNLTKWWEVGKAQIQIFCQQYTAHHTAQVRQAVRPLERDILLLEQKFSENKNNDNNSRIYEELTSKRQELTSILQEKAKGA